MFMLELPKMLKRFLSNIKWWEESMKKNKEKTLPVLIGTIFEPDQLPPFKEDVLRV